MCVHVGLPSVCILSYLHLWHFTLPLMGSVKFTLSDLCYFTHSLAESSRPSSEFCTELWVWEEVRIFTKCNNRVQLCVLAVVLAADVVDDQTTTTSLQLLSGLHHVTHAFWLPGNMFSSAMKLFECSLSLFQWSQQSQNDKKKILKIVFNIWNDPALTSEIKSHIVNLCCTLCQGFWYWLMSLTSSPHKIKFYVYDVSTDSFPSGSDSILRKIYEMNTRVLLHGYDLELPPNWWGVLCAKTNGNYLNLPLLSMSSVGPINFNLSAIWLIFQAETDENQCNNQADSWEFKYYLSVKKRKAVLVWQRKKNNLL